VTLAAVAGTVGFVWMSRTLERRTPAQNGADFDLVRIQDRILTRVGHAGVDVRDLGGGIIELVGEAADWDEAHRLVEAASTEPGVVTVLNRLWVRTPTLVS